MVQFLSVLLVVHHGLAVYPVPARSSLGLLLHLGLDQDSVPENYLEPKLGPTIVAHNTIAIQLHFLVV